jgi:hypothetical protein
MMFGPEPAHPWIAEWVKVLIAAIAGFISAVVVDIIRTNRQKKQAIHDMRVALYNELGQRYSNITLFLRQAITTPVEQEGIAANLRLLSTNTYDWAKAQPAVFYKLKESHLIDNMYSSFTMMRSHLNTKGTGKHTITAARAFLHFIEDAVRKKVFDNELFERQVPLYYGMIKDSIANGGTDFEGKLPIEQ